MHPHFFSTTRLPDDAGVKPRPRRGAPERLDLTPLGMPRPGPSLPPEVPSPDRSRAADLAQGPRYANTAAPPGRGGVLMALKRRFLPAPAL